MNMLSTAAARMIPADTLITDKQFKTLKELSIPSRAKKLGKCKIGDIESTIWLMQELEHLRKLEKYNEDHRAIK